LVQESALQQAVTHLTQAEQDYSTLGSLHALMQVQGFLSMVYHRLGLMDERDGVAGRHSQTSAESERLRKSEVDDEVKHVWETVQMIGSVIGSRNHKLVQ
jgi:anaphase-promoting complex subunit 5